MSVFKRVAILTASLAATAAVTTACNAYSSSAAAPAAAATGTTAPAAPQSGTAQNSSGQGSSNGSAANAGAALIAAASSSLGQIVTNGSGMTLYRFDKDTNKPPTSNCSGDCATNWPPATVADSVSLNGIDKSLVGTVTRADGTKQLTLNGWPLYTFAGDSKPGDTNGQGVGGTWYAVTPTGGKAKAGAAGTSAGSNGNSSGYGNSGGSTSSSGW